MQHGDSPESGDRTVDTHRARAKLKALRVGLDDHDIGASGTAYRLINHARASVCCSQFCHRVGSIFVLTVFVNEIKPSVAVIMEKT